MSIRGFSTFRVMFRVAQEEGVLALWSGGWPSIFKVKFYPSSSEILPFIERCISITGLFLFQVVAVTTYRACSQTIPATAITFGVFEVCKTAILLANEEKEALASMLEKSPAFKVEPKQSLMENFKKIVI